MQAKAIARTVQEAAHQEFRLRVFRPDSAHDAAPDFLGEIVGHRNKGCHQ